MKTNRTMSIRLRTRAPSVAILLSLVAGFLLLTAFPAQAYGETRNLCLTQFRSENLAAAGWVITAADNQPIRSRFGTNFCPIPLGEPGVVAGRVTATSTAGAPAGSTMVVCDLSTVPAGWLKGAAIASSACLSGNSVSAFQIYRPGSTGPEQSTMCLGSSVPTGWVVSATYWSNACPANVPNNTWTITNVQGMAAGSVQIACYMSPIPYGWVITSTSTANGCPAGVLNNQYLLKNLNGLAVGSMALACYISPIPAGWTVSYRYYTNGCPSGIQNNGMTLVRSA